MLVSFEKGQFVVPFYVSYIMQKNNSYVEKVLSDNFMGFLHEY